MPSTGNTFRGSTGKLGKVAVLALVEAFKWSTGTAEAAEPEDLFTDSAGFALIAGEHGDADRPF